MVQLVAYGIDMGSFLLGVYLGLVPVAANIPAKLMAGAFAFAAHRRYTFDARQHGAGGQLVRYALLLVLNVPMSSGALSLLLPVLKAPAVAKFVADTVCVGLTFLASRYLVFRAGAKAVE